MSSTVINSNPPRKKRKLASPGCDLFISYRGLYVLSFGSSAVKPFNVLSNFGACELSIGGKRFPSVEHWYQSQKAKANSEAFQVGGAFASWDCMKRFWPSSMVEKKISFWKKKNNIGILAKMAVSRALNGTRIQKASVGIELNAVPLTFDSFEAAAAMWCPVLKAKVEQNPQVSLVVTEHRHKYFLEFSRGAERESRKGNPPVWAGLIKDGELFGQNWMGRCWMEVANQVPFA
jgi:hypothetical protein